MERLTENEAIERLQCMRLFMEINDKQNDNKFLEDDYMANEMAIKALEEIQQYRAIGTVEELQALKERNDWRDMEMYGLGYNQGTIDRADELQKCREQGYKKAIDEFAERIKQGDVIEYMGSYVSYEAIASFIDEIAEQMKEGEKNEIN